MECIRVKIEIPICVMSMFAQKSSLSKALGGKREGMRRVDVCTEVKPE